MTHTWSCRGSGAAAKLRYRATEVVAARRGRVVPGGGIADSRPPVPSGRD